jgi:hypothetical protein
MRAQFLLTCCRHLVWLALSLSAACASSPAPSNERIDAAFRAIQASEAQIEAAARRVDQITSSIASDAEACVERCAPLDQAIAQAGQGAAGVCDSAAGLDDSDARTRCERARERSAALQQRASELRGRCGCGLAQTSASAP